MPAFVIDRDRTIRWLNIAARDLVGDKEGSPFTDVVSTESLPLVRDEFTRKMIGTSVATEYAAYLLNKDGGRIRVEVSSVSVDVGGEIVGVFGVASVQQEVQSVASEAPALTPRQAQVLRLLARGCSTVQIAAQLGLADETVRNHVRGVLRRLGVHSRLEAVVAAHDRGLL